MFKALAEMPEQVETITKFFYENTRPLSQKSRTLLLVGSGTRWISLETCSRLCQFSGLPLES